MGGTALIKNITFSEPHAITELVDYEEGRVVSAGRWRRTNA
jgi:hypothetical protein